MRRTACCLFAATVALSDCARSNSASTARADASTPVGTSGTSETETGATVRRPASIREMTLPAGTHMPVVLETMVGSDISRVEEPVRAHLARAITLDDVSLLPEGSRLSGIDTVAVGRTAPSTTKKNVLEIGLPAAGGAVIGGLPGGTNGALLGTAAGGGAGTAIVMSTHGREIRLPRGAVLTLRLVRPVAVRVAEN